MALFGGTSKKEKKEKSASKSRARSTTSTHGISHDIIRAPWFSEKALIGTEKGVYVFSVPSEATKAQIAGAIKEIYNVQPRKIRVANLPAKKKPMRSRRGIGSRASRHKAYVYLVAGETIQLS